MPAPLKSALELASRGNLNGSAVMINRPYRVVDRRAAYGFIGGGSDQLYDASKASNVRRQVQTLATDTHKAISASGRDRIMSFGRLLFANFPSIEGAIQEQAALAVSTFYPRYMGRNREWGKRAEQWLVDWEEIMTVAGSWFEGDLVRELLLYSVLVDGELGILLTETPSGWPAIQLWMSHLIGDNHTSFANRDLDEMVIDGVEVNQFRRPKKYLLSAAGEIKKVPASDFILAYCPTRPDQVRGISKLGSSVNDWQDIAESRRFELLAQKACSAHALIEHNETGEVDETKSVIQSDATFDSTDNGLVTPTVESLEGGIYKYFAAKSGGKLEAFKFDRPGANVQNFQREVEMHAFRGLEWDRGFTLDSARINGTSIRVVVDRINRTVRKRQKLVKKVFRRIHSYAVAKAIGLGELPFDEDWYRWDYQVPATVTPDTKRQSDVDIQEYERAFTTMQDICAKRGSRWEETQDQWLLEKKRLQEQAQSLGVVLGSPEPKQKQPLEEETVRKIIDDENSSDPTEAS